MGRDIAQIAIARGIEADRRDAPTAGLPLTGTISHTRSFFVSAVTSMLREFGLSRVLKMQGWRCAHLPAGRHRDPSRESRFVAGTLPRYRKGVNSPLGEVFRLQVSHDFTVITPVTVSNTRSNKQGRSLGAVEHGKKADTTRFARLRQVGHHHQHPPQDGTDTFARRATHVIWFLPTHRFRAAVFLRRASILRPVASDSRCNDGCRN
jgi:hypothetical protein